MTNRLLALMLLTVVGIAPIAREVCDAICHWPAASADVAAHQGHHGEHHVVSPAAVPGDGPALTSPRLVCDHASDGTAASIVAPKRDLASPLALPPTMVAAALAPAGPIGPRPAFARGPVPIPIRTPLRV